LITTHVPWMIVVPGFLWVINTLHDPCREIVCGNGPRSRAISERLLMYSWAHGMLPVPCLPSRTKIGEISVEVVVNYAGCLGYGISLRLYYSRTTSYCSIIYYGCHTVIGHPHPIHAPSEVTTIPSCTVLPCILIWCVTNSQSGSHQRGVTGFKRVWVLACETRPCPSYGPVLLVLPVCRPTHHEPGLSSVIYAPNALQIRKTGISPISRHITASSLSTLIGSMQDCTSTLNHTPYIHDITGMVDHRCSHSIRHRYASCRWIFQHLHHWRAV